MQGSKGEVSRLGHNTLTITADGWDVGAKVKIYVNQAGEDEVAIYKTDGSNGYSEELIATINAQETKLRDALILGVKVL